MGNRKVYRYLATYITSALLILCGTIHANPLASIKAAGMGGACVAYGQDSLTAYFNPATAIMVCTSSDLGLSTCYENRHIDLWNRTGNAQSGEFNTIHNWDFFGQAGLNVRTGCCNEWAFGVQWNNYDLIHNHYGTPIVDFSGGTATAPLGTPLKFENRTEVLSCTTAYHIGWGHTVGVAANCYFSWLSVRGFEKLASSTFSLYPNHVTNKATDYSHGVGVTAGWLGQFFCDDSLTLGFSYSPRVGMTHFDKYIGLLATHSIDIPETFRFGGAWVVAPCLTIAGDAEFRRYSRVRTLSNNFPYSTTGRITTLFGDEYGPGFGWNDQWIARGGFAWQPWQCLVLRAGYRYEQCPIRRSGKEATALNITTIDVVQNYATCGFTYCYCPCFDISFFGEYGVIDQRVGKLPEIDEGTQFVGGDIKYRAYTVSLGVGCGWNY